MEIVICVGSGCHLKGSKAIQDKINVYLEEKDLVSQVRLKGTFCRGHCQKGVSMSIDGEDILSVTVENIEQILDKYLQGEIND